MTRNHRCAPCNLDFTRTLFQRHLKRDHRLDPCKMCSRPVVTFQFTPLGATLDYCSGACVAEVRRRRLCFHCFAAYTSDIEAYFCLSCSKALDRRVSPFGGALRFETAINQSRWLPRIYQRYDPNAWKLLHLRKEDVA